MHTTGNTDHLTRSNVWTTELKELLEETLTGVNYVKWLMDGEGASTINIPSIGQGEAYDYSENEAIRYNSLDTGNFTFVPSEYLASGNYITEKAKQDLFYFSQLVSSFVPKQRRAIEARMEADLFAVGPAGQTASNYNLINGARHRFVGSGTNEQMALNDIAYARFALKKANVPDENLIGIVDPSVAMTLNKLANTQAFNYNPQFQGVVQQGFTKGMKFLYNIHGFDIYESNSLADLNETNNGVTTAAGKANLFFSAASDILPFVGKMVQPPKVDSSYNKDFQREEYVTTARYGFGLYRPENLVVIATDTDQVYA